MADISESSRNAIDTVDPTRYFVKYAKNTWRGEGYLDEVTAVAAAPVIEKYNRPARGRGRVHGEHDVLGDGIDPARPRLRIAGAPLMSARQRRRARSQATLDGVREAGALASRLMSPTRRACTRWTEPDSLGRRMSPVQNASAGAERVDPSQQRNSLEAGAVSETRVSLAIKFHEDKLEEFKRLTAQCMEIVRTKDTGTLQYDIYLKRRSVRVRRPRAVQGLRRAHRARYAPWRPERGNPCDGLRPPAHSSVSRAQRLRAKLADSEVRLFTPYESM